MCLGVCLRFHDWQIIKITDFLFVELEMIILFTNQSNYQMMNQKASESDEHIDTGRRFLMRHSSSSILNIFGCCSASSHYDLETAQPEKTQPQKISIKNVLKKSAIYDCNGHASIKQSRLYQGGSTSQLNCNSKPFLNRKISQLSQLSSRTIDNKSSRITPEKTYQNVNLMYNKDQSNNSIHNYHTTNYLVEKYIVQAQQMNVLLKKQNEKKEKYTQKQTYHQQPQFTPNEQIGQPLSQSPKWNHDSPKFVPPKFPSNKEENQQNNCHFSFGQHQKKFFMNKFGGFREVTSNRPSKQSAMIENEEDVASIDFGDNQPKAPIFLRNKNQKLHNLVRDVQTMNEEMDDSCSDKSEVIDSYQNHMSRIQDKNRMMSLAQNQQM